MQERSQCGPRVITRSSATASTVASALAAIATSRKCDLNRPSIFARTFTLAYEQAVSHSHTFAHVTHLTIQLAPRTCVRREVGVALQWHIFCFVNRDVVIPMRTPNFTRTVPGIALPVQWYSSVDFHSFSQVDLYSLVYCCYYLYVHVNLHVPSDVYCLFVHGLVFDLALAVLIICLLVPSIILLFAQFWRAVLLVLSRCPCWSFVLVSATVVNWQRVHWTQ